MKGQFRVEDFGRLVELLTKSLYGTDPAVAIRELVQNSIDAINKVKSFGDDDYQGEIELRLDDDVHPYRLTVRDNGVGMTESELVEILTVVGESSKSPDAINTIGQFGIGFLAAFIVADKIELETLAIGSERQVRWVADRSFEWTTESIPAGDTTPGTTISLTLSDDWDESHGTQFRALRTYEGLVKIIHEIAYLSDIPIFVTTSGEGRRRANAIEHPWDSKIEAEDIFAKLFDGPSPIFIHQFSIDENDLACRGVLYTVPSLVHSPSLRLFSRGLLVKPDETKLLPSYAGMMTGIVDFPNAVMQLSRKEIDEYSHEYQWLRSQILGQVEQSLLDFMTAQPDEFLVLWRRIDLTTLSRLMLVANDTSDPVAEEAADRLILKSFRHIPLYTRDRTTGAFSRPYIRTIDSLAVLRGATTAAPVEIVYTESQVSAEKELLIEKYDLVVDVSDRQRSVYADLVTYFQTIQPRDVELDFTLVRGEVAQFEPISGAQVHEWEELRREVQATINFGERPLSVVVDNFSGYAEASHVIVTDVTAPDVTDNPLVKALRSQFQSDSSGVEQMFQDLLDRMERGDGVVTIHLNCRSQLLLDIRQSIADGARNESTMAKNGLQSLVWKAVIEFFGSFATGSMQRQDKRFTYDMVRTSIVLARSYDQQLEESEARMAVNGNGSAKARGDSDVVLDGPVVGGYLSCFLAVAYTERGDELFAALKEVVEQEPFFGRVRRADKEVKSGDLWTNATAVLSDCQVVIAAMTGSDHNANVMIELGYAEGLQKPVWIVRDEDSAEVPVDISWRIHSSVGGSGVDLVESVRVEFKKHAESLEFPIGSAFSDRYLSPGAMDRYGMQREAAEKIGGLNLGWSHLAEEENIADILRQVGILDSRQAGTVTGVLQRMAADFIGTNEKLENHESELEL